MWFKISLSDFYNFKIKVYRPDNEQKRRSSPSDITKSNVLLCALILIGRLILARHLLCDGVALLPQAQWATNQEAKNFPLGHHIGSKGFELLTSMMNSSPPHPGSPLHTLTQSEGLLRWDCVGQWAKEVFGRWALIDALQGDADGRFISARHCRLRGNMSDLWSVRWRRRRGRWRGNAIKASESWRKGRSHVAASRKGWWFEKSILSDFLDLFLTWLVRIQYMFKILRGRYLMQPEHWGRIKRWSRFIHLSIIHPSSIPASSCTQGCGSLLKLDLGLLLIINICEDLLFSNL